MADVLASLRAALVPQVAGDVRFVHSEAGAGAQPGSPRDEPGKDTFTFHADGFVFGTVQLDRQGRCPFSSAEHHLIQQYVQRASYALQTALRYENNRRIAHAFQNAALDVPFPDVPGLRFDAVYHAGSADATIGGDWHEAFVLHDGRVIVSVGDVMGSGIRAAVQMMSVRQALRAICSVEADPGAIVKAAELALDRQYPGSYVSTTVAVFDPITQVCSYVNAGHPPALMRTPNGGVYEFAGRGLALGIFPEGDRASVNHLSIAPGSLLVMYTDGLIEAGHDVCDGLERLYRIVGEIDPTNENIATTIYERMGIVRGRDDIAILTVAFEGVPVKRWRFDPIWEDATARVRREMESELLASGCSADALFAFHLIFAEIVANLVRYSEGVAEMILEKRDGTVVLHVLDHGPGYALRHDPRLPRDVFSQSGRGLYLIAQLARHFTVLPRPGGGSHARISLPR